MRYIQKNGDGGYRLNTANETPPATKKEAQSRWSNFRHKPSVAPRLNIEQYGLCAYSEIRCDLYSLGTHIEHIEPKSQAPQRTFDYQNLVLSALSSDDLYTMDRKDVFSGHAKLSEYDAELFISCLQVDCASFFVYLLNGQVEPNSQLAEEEQKKAQYTINLLNLNSPYLVTQRKNWIDELDQLIDEQFYGTINLNPIKANMDFATIVEEVVQQLTEKLGVDVSISVEIQAQSSEEFDEGLQRSIKENCHVLKFSNADFEEG